MRFNFFLPCLVLFLALGACGDSSSASIDGNDGPATSKKSEKKNQTNVAAPATQEPQTAAPAQAKKKGNHDCVLMGKVLEDNQIWMSELDLILAVVADTAERYDKDFPESHRSFQIYDSKICDLIGNHVMPINREPDYPYYLYPNTYESINQMMCAQGAGYVYCFDIKRKEMLLPLIPEYRSKQMASDASSGAPQGLMVWDHYLFGYVADYGAYAFDMTNKKAVKSLFPAAEFLDREKGSMNQLFLTESAPGKFQAAFSSYDVDAGENAFTVVPLFKEALPISSRIPASARNNNLLVFKYKDASSAIGVDMAKGKSIAIPAAVASKPVQEILAWVKSQ